MNYDTREHPADGSPMVLVPAGPFLMGVPDNDFLAEEHEKPQRRVQMSAFWIDIYPITNSRFARFLSAGGYQQSTWWTPAGWEWRRRYAIQAPLQWGQPAWDGPEQPVAGVSWYEADAYARWAGRRLPTDAEWEKAARGTDGRRYPWGDAWPTPDRANFAMTIGHSSVIGLYPEGVSPWGCQDMAGNVNNWTSDWYWPQFGRHCQEHGLLDNPHCDDALTSRLGLHLTEKVDRGGGYATPREYQEVLGCTCKVHWPPASREPWNGFRTALDAP